MHYFHKYMSRTYRQSEEHNLKPLRQYADSRLVAAKTWERAPVPDGYDKAAVVPVLKRLVKQCE